MFKSNVIKLIMVVSVLILLLILLKFYLDFEKSKNIELEDWSNFSVELSEKEVLDIKNWLLENVKSTSENLDLNDF